MRNRGGLISRRAFASIGCALLLGLTGCGNTASDGRSVTSEETAPKLLEVTGVFHPSTGKDDPAAYSGIDYDTIYQRLADSEKSDSKKTLFVAVKLNADANDNIEIPIRVDGARNRISGAELTIDSNTYKDNWSYNKGGSQEGIATELGEAGYTDGTGGVTLSGGSDDSYKAIFMFWISNKDYESGGTAHLTWNDYETDVDLSSMQEVTTAHDIAAALSE